MRKVENPFETGLPHRLPRLSQSVKLTEDSQNAIRHVERIELVIVLNFLEETLNFHFELVGWGSQGGHLMITVQFSRNFSMQLF